MISESKFQRCLVWMYDVLLYAYPREFRWQYGKEMQRMFRDQLRDSAGSAAGVTGSQVPWSFFLRTAIDWMATALREQLLAGGPYLLTYWLRGAPSLISAQLHPYGTTLLTFAGMLNLAALADAWALERTRR